MVSCGLNKRRIGSKMDGIFVGTRRRATFLRAPAIPHAVPRAAPKATVGRILIGGSTWCINDYGKAYANLPTHVGRTSRQCTLITPFQLSKAGVTAYFLQENSLSSAFWGWTLTSSFRCFGPLSTGKKLTVLGCHVRWIFPNTQPL